MPGQPDSAGNLGYLLCVPDYAIAAAYLACIRGLCIYFGYGAKHSLAGAAEREAK